MKLFAFIFVILTHVNIGSTQSAIYGNVSNIITGEKLLFARISVLQNGKFAGGGISEYNGQFYISVKSGVYDLKVSYQDYPDHLITEVIINEGDEIEINIELFAQSKNLVVVKRHTPEQYNADVLFDQDVRILPTKTTSPLTSISTKCNFTVGPINISEIFSRNKISAVYIDGMRYDPTEVFILKERSSNLQYAIASKPLSDLTFLERYNLRD